MESTQTFLECVSMNTESVTTWCARVDSNEKAKAATCKWEPGEDPGRRIQNGGSQHTMPTV